MNTLSPRSLLGLAAPALLLLGGCATAGSLDGIPEERLSCPDQPSTPVGQGPNGEVTDEENNEYLRRLHGAWKGCWNDIQWIRDYRAKKKG